MFAGLGGPLIEYLKNGGLKSIDPQAFANVLAQSWAAFLGIMIVVCLFMSILMGGIYRLVLRPQERGFAHLRLGPDELRLAVVNLLLLPLGLVFLATVDLVGAQVAAQLGPTVGLLAAIAVAVPMIWLGVRLLLATPTTFAEHRLAIGPSWELSRGRVWPLFGMMLLAVIFYIVVWALILIIYAALTQIGGGTENVFAAGSKITPTAVILLLLTILLQMILPVLQVVMLYAPVAVAYQQLHGDPPARGG
jgi:hypothetical protein